MQYGKSYCVYSLKLSHVDEEQTVFDHLTLSNFKMWSSIALKASCNYSIRMTNNSDNIKIMRVVLLSLLLTSESIQQYALKEIDYLLP